MQITKELLQNDKLALEAQAEQLRVSLAQTNGALQTIKGMIEYLDRPEPTPEEPSKDISEVNKAVQDAVEARMHADAIPLQEIAEALAGPNAVVEGIDEIDTNGVIHEVKAEDYIPASASLPRRVVEIDEKSGRFVKAH